MKKYVGVFLFGAVAVAPLFLLAAYNHPTDDDYCTYQLFHDRSPWEAFQYGYENFSGRYTYLLLFSQWDPLYSANWLLATRLWPLIALAAFMITVRIILHFTLKGNSPREQWVLWIVLTVVLLEGWPSIASSFYWFTGATVYTLAMMCAALSLIFLHASLATPSTTGKISWIAGAGILALVAAGSNEVLISFLLIFTLALLIWTKAASSRFPVEMMAFLLIVSAGAYVALSAPGNFKRASDMLHRTADFSYALQVGVKCVYLVTLKIGSWLTRFPLWLAALLVAALSSAVNFSWMAPRNKTQLAMVAIIMFTIMAGMAFLSCYAYNDIIPRVWNVIYFFFVFSFIYLVVFTVRLFTVAAPVISFIHDRWLLFTFVTLLLCTVSATSNLTVAWNDLFFRAREYDEGLTRRYEALRGAAASGQNFAVVEPLFRHTYQYPRTLFLNDLRPEPDQFPNTCISYFFGLDEIRLSCCPQESRHLE